MRHGVNDDAALGGAGPLEGIRVIEFAARGPVELAGLLFSQLGASVQRIERPGEPDRSANTILRGRSSRALDLKSDGGRAEALELIRDADVLVEGFRPGVMERLGLGPDAAAEHNPRIVYGRMTGWGQHGQRAQHAGHDINYLAETGALWAVRGAHGDTAIPLNLVGDNGGGALYLVTGVLAALLSTPRRAVVVDAAIVDGVSSLLETVRGLRNVGEWGEHPRDNLFDGGWPAYSTYRCQDGREVAFGAVEEKFYRNAVIALGLDPERLPDRDDRAQWPRLRTLLAAAFAQRTRDEWDEVFSRIDGCVSPVLTLTEAAESPHLRQRQTLLRSPDGGTIASAAPRFHPIVM